MKMSQAHTVLIWTGIALAMLISAGAQAQTPARPLLLIGGTFVHSEFGGAELEGQPISGWEELKDWFEERGGYQRDAWNQRIDLLGACARARSRPPP